MSVNHQPVIKYSYEFAAADGQSYPGSSNALPKPQIGDEANESVLYLPSNPKVSMLVDALPARRRRERPMVFGQQSRFDLVVWPGVAGHHCRPVLCLLASARLNKSGSSELGGVMASLCHRCGIKSVDPASLCRNFPLNPEEP
jgi:hypothetical protein